MSYVIKRMDQGGGYLRPSPQNGWTNNLAYAKRFPTFEAAQAECCPENERPVPVDSLLQPVR